MVRRVRRLPEINEGLAPVAAIDPPEVIDVAVVELVRIAASEAEFDVQRNVSPPFESQQVESMTLFVRQLIDIFRSWDGAGWFSRRQISGRDLLTHAYELLDELSPCQVLVDHLQARKRGDTKVDRSQPYVVDVTQISEACKQVKKKFVEFSREVAQALESR